ncbi:MAG: LysR substrate-binding domain-containing protein [Xanthobacteraceae bacterium]
MELRRLNYFVAVAEAKSFTLAAKRLGIKQPPLSLQIRKLEKEMGAQLFDRGTRSVELTNTGRLLLEQARAILRQVEQTKTDVRRRARGETGRVNVGSGVGTQFHPLIPEIIREYGEHYPEVVMCPQANGSALLVARLLAGTIDVAFIYLPIDNVEGLAIDPLAEEPFVAVLPLGHLLSRSASLHLRALAGEKFVMFSRELNPAHYDALVAAVGHTGVTPTLGQNASLNIAAVPMVAAGMGWSVVPQSFRRILPDDVAYVRIDDDFPPSAIALARRRDDHSTAVQNFVTCARRQARGQFAAKALATA